tara:strand:+ start:12985 stop:13404 length:420 start_codon:yes stop_codon:yes gene_type:complete
MVNTADFTKRLEKIMDYYALSAAAFAEEIDFNRSTISHLLSGRNKPSLEFVMKLYQKFPDIDMDWLLFGKGNFPSTGENLKRPENQKQIKTPNEENSLNLFSEEDNADDKRVIQANRSSNTIEKIVIFYTDGSFKVYQN